MNIKTAENIYADIVGLVKFYVTKQNRGTLQPIPVHVTPANIKNLAYYRYTHNANACRYRHRTFKSYLAAFTDQHVNDGQALHVEIQAGCGMVPVTLIEYIEA